MDNNKGITKRMRILACKGNVRAESAAKMCNASLAKVHNIWHKDFITKKRFNERFKNWKNERY